MKKLAWGILGAGGIAGKFAEQLPLSESGRLAAVGSRSVEKAAAFAQRHGGAACDYQQLLRRDDVDAVYVALPNALHESWTIQALEAGKHVLCEKPLAIRGEQVQQMFAAAKQHDRVLSEAFMYRHHPAVQKVISLAREGAIGEVKLIRANFTFHRADSPEDIRYQPQLEGGALYDVGCYCVHFARAITGLEPQPSSQVCFHRHASGVDDYAAGVLNFNGRVLATFTCGMTVFADRTTYIGGSEGFLAIDTPWFSDGEITLAHGQGRELETIQAGRTVPLYALEADAFAQAVAGEAEPLISPEDSLGNAQALEMLAN